MAIPISRHEVHADGSASAKTDGPAFAATAEDGGVVALPRSSFIADGLFRRDGGDLVISHVTDGEAVIREYFGVDRPPDLISPDGSQVLTPALVGSFLSPSAPGQYAQAAPFVSPPPVGQVIDLDGQAFAVRADGTRVQLAKGDALHEGDIVETAGEGSAIRMVFTDNTEFSLGADARLALDQLVFNPDTQSGAAQFSVLKGVFIFASGQIAKTDNTDMTVVTPVATIGIRGTEVAGRVSASDSQFTVIDGAIEVTTQAGSATLDSRGETTRVAGNDRAPSEPVVVTPAEFGEAYGEIAGVAPAFFDPSQPAAPGGEVPGGPPAPEPEPPAAGPGDRADSGAAAPVATALSGSLTQGGAIAPISATLADAAAFAPAAVQGGNLADGGAAGSAADTSVIVAVPGIDLAEALTYAPSGGGITAAGVDSVALFPASRGTFELVAEQRPVGDGAGPALDQLSSGGSGSPFRSESGSAGSFSSNPYITAPFGYAGPQLGDPVFDLAAGEPEGPTGLPGPALDFGDAAEAVPVPNGSTAANASRGVPAPGPLPAEITLVVSQATRDQQHQDLTNGYELPDRGPGSFVLVRGDEMAIPGVSAGAEISLRRDGDGNVEVALTSAWDSVKNIRAESAAPGEITIDNFVHADVDFGDGGDSHVTIRNAKRGFVMTGDGDDRIEIETLSNGPGWSNTFEVGAGAGDDTLVFDGDPNGHSRLYFDGGEGYDTLKLSGFGDSFSLASGQVRVSGVERIDISGPGDTTLAIPASLVGQGDMIVVEGDAGDTLELIGGDWRPGEETDIDGQGYALYEHASGMRVAADLDLQVAG